MDPLPGPGQVGFQPVRQALSRDDANPPMAKGIAEGPDLTAQEEMESGREAGSCPRQTQSWRARFCITEDVTTHVTLWRSAVPSAKTASQP